MQSDSPSARQLRYLKMIKMLKNHHSSKDDTQKLEQIKKETVFEIQLRHNRCEINHNYKFPRFITSQDKMTEDQVQLYGKRDFLFNLHNQKKIPEQKVQLLTRKTIQKMQNNRHHSSTTLDRRGPINQIVTNKQQNKISRDKLQIRIQQVKNRSKMKTQRQMTQRTNGHSEQRVRIINPRNLILNDHQISRKGSSNAPSNNSHQKLQPIIKTPIKNRSKKMLSTKKFRIATESTPVSNFGSLKQPQIKGRSKLYTEANTDIKQKEYLSNKKVEIILSSMLDKSDKKNLKNVFYKKFF